MIKAGIIGGTGITAGELIRILLYHPSVDIDFVYSTSQAGQPVSAVHTDLLGQTDLAFSGEVNPEVDVVFLALGHGNSKKFLEENNFSSSTKIIDLSRDFRLKHQAVWNGKTFVYGLPELHKETIKKASNIANPGCFATAIQLSLLPLAQNNLIQTDVHIHAITGATGAGRSLMETTSFNWRNNNLSVYKAFTHQHIDEIKENIDFLQPGFHTDLNFVPMRGDFSRGIFASVYLDSALDEAEVQSLYKDFYQDSPFTQVSDQPVHLKQVVNTNQAFINVSKYGAKVHITTVIDNLLKGASGQAVENMNLMFGFKQDEGLRLKPVVF